MYSCSALAVNSVFWPFVVYCGGYVRTLINDLNSVVGFLFSSMSSIFALYVGGGVLSGVFALWLLRKVSTLFNRLK